MANNRSAAAGTNLNRLAYFAAVVEAGTFTAAAERLGITKAVVSQQVARLEQDLGTTLLTRSTRRVQLTDAGRGFYERCAAILRDAGAAFDALAATREVPSGALRITATLDYGAAAVAPALARFAAMHPQVHAHLNLTDQRVDLLAGRFDVAVRVGWLADSGYQARRLCTFEQWLVCSAGLARKLPRLKEPADLRALPWVANTALKNAARWRFQRRSESTTVSTLPVITADTTIGTHACVLAGAGLSVLPDYLVRDAVERGNLVRVLPQWLLPLGGVHAVLPAMRFRSAAVRAFVDFMAAAAAQLAARSSESRAMP